MRGSQPYNKLGAESFRGRRSAKALWWEAEMYGWQSEQRQKAARAGWRVGQGPDHRPWRLKCGVRHFPVSCGKPLKNFKQGKDVIFSRL